VSFESIGDPDQQSVSRSTDRKEAGGVLYEVQSSHCGEPSSDMKRIFKWFMSHPWYERIIIAIPTLVITLLVVWFVFTAIVFAVIFALGGCQGKI
jgi:hypothetical protein